MYRDYTEYLRQHFPDFKVQKISLNAGFTCPNRDGEKGIGGCTYCNNSSFTPNYTSKLKPIAQQMQEGIDFFSYKYPEMRFLAYFQAYTNTYDDIKILKERYGEALSLPKVEGIIIGTRPDCVSDELLNYLSELSKQTFVYMEYGVETTKEETLLAINRGHTFEESKETILKTNQAGIPVGVHLIIGLPNETRSDYLTHVQNIAALPVTSIKLHQLQILKGTIMGQQYLQSPERFHLLSADEYIEILGELLPHIPDTIYLDRFVSQAPAHLLLAPNWQLKNYQFTHKLLKYLETHQIKQGSYHTP